MENLHTILIKQIDERLIQGGIHRILSCLERLSQDQLYWRPNENSNSINNLILHLDGNVRQWLIASLSHTKDLRVRDAEFDTTNQKTKIILIEILNQLEKDVRAVFPDLQQCDLLEMKSVQCYEESVLSIIIHVIEHFSYHVGQITYVTKLLLDVDTGYYSGMDLNNTNQTSKG